MIAYSIIVDFYIDVALDDTNELYLKKSVLVADCVFLSRNSAQDNHKCPHPR